MVTRDWTAKPSGSRIPHPLFVHVTLPIVGVGILLLAIGLYGAWRVHRLHQRGVNIVAGNVADIREAEQLQAAVREVRYRLKRFGSTGDERHLEEIARLLPEARKQCDQIDSQGLNADTAHLVDRIKLALDEFQAIFGQLHANMDTRAQRERAILLADGSVPEKIFEALEEYVAINDEQVERSRERNQTTANRLMFGLLLFGTCGGVAGLFLGYAIARRVGRTIVEVAVSLQDVAGKLDRAVGPVTVTANPSIQDVEGVLEIISKRVSTVVERLQASERETLRAEQLAAVGQLAAGLAHEIRNPLTSMKTIIQLAESPTDLTFRDLRILHEEILRLEESVQTFLDYARPAQAEKRHVDLRELLEQPVALVSRRADRQGIEFIFEPPDFPLPVTVDAVQIRQVLLNLLLNAFDATAAGGSVQLKAAVQYGAAPQLLEINEEYSANVSRPPTHVSIHVIDSGTGLPEHLGSRIFDPFVSTKDTGIGLGLSISRRIVENHDGQIVAENRRQHGAVFMVRLPLTPHSLVAGHEMPSGQLDEAPDGTSRGRSPLPSREPN